MIVFFGFIYLVQLFLSNEVDKLGYYKIIRFRNITRWFWSWMKGLLIAVALFLFTLLVFSLVIGMGFGMNIRLYLTILPNPLFEVIYHFFIYGFLQIVFYIFVAFIVSWIGKESLHGVMLISLFMVLMLPGVNTTGIIPVGLNSIVYLTNFSPYYLTAILVLTNVVAFIVVTYLFRKSLII